jgi:microcin C transport system substrate-binding protein
LSDDDIIRGQRVTFRRLESWWADDKLFYKNRYNPDTLIYIVIRDDFKAFESFLNGSIDFFSLNSTELWYDRADAASIRNGYIERAQFYTLLPAGSFGIQMNSMQPLLDNRDIRIGIQHAINYERVNTDIYRGDRRRIRSFVDGYGPYDHPDLQAREDDIDQALASFAKAGFTERGANGILTDSSGRPLSFTLTATNSSQESRVALLLKEEAAQAGLELRIEELDPTAQFSKLFEKNHELIISGWSTGFATVPTFEWEMRGEDAGKAKNFNTTNIKDDALDALLARWDTLQDPQNAYQVSHDIQEKIHEFAAWVPGLTTDFTRVGYWRWVQWPEYFHGPKSNSFTGMGVFWIDEKVKEETLEARKKGRAYPPVTEIHDLWKQ